MDQRFLETQTIKWFSSAREEHIIIIFPFQDDSDALSLRSGLNLSLEPRFLLQFFSQKQEAVLEGHIYPKFSLETKLALYNDFISQLEHELACSKEKERDLSERWNQSAQRVLERQQHEKELRASLQQVSRELKEALAENHRQKSDGFE